MKPGLHVWEKSTPVSKYSSFNKSSVSTLVTLTKKASTYFFLGLIDSGNPDFPNPPFTADFNFKVFIIRLKWTLCWLCTFVLLSALRSMPKDVSGRDFGLDQF